MTTAAVTPNNPQTAPQVDYDALAKQAGAVSSTPSTPDYDALAKQAGAVSSTPDYDALAKQAGATSSTPSTSSNVIQGIKETGSDIWGAIKGAATTVFPGQSDLVSGIQEAIPAFHAYEQARSQGKGVVDSLSAANDEMGRQQQARDVLKQRVDEFKKNPTIATVRAVGDAAALATSIYAGGAMGSASDAAASEAGAEGATADTATAAPKPNIVKQAWQGEKVAQAPAKAALRSGAQASAVDAGVPEAASNATGGGSIRTLLDDPIESLSTKERAAYDSINDASGTDLKALYDTRAKYQDAVEDPAQIANHDTIQSKLEGIEAQIKTGETQAKANGVDLDTLEDAKAMTQQRYAMEDVNKKLFANNSVVNGNVKYGAPETINVDSAIRQVENLDQPSRFAPRGTPSRLEQAFGEDGAQNLKQGLYDAQKAGETALTVQKWAKYAGGAVGLGAIEETARHLMP
jgi:hypothetical protein